MASANDVAAYILDKCSPLTVMKLQKLLYYSQAWHLVWDEEPLFTEHIEAWANGPVVPHIYRQHRGEFRLSSWPSGDGTKLTPSESETVDIVLDTYRDMPAWELSNLAHQEAPWKTARGDTPPGYPSNAEITHAAMHEYYDGLYELEED